ncbi:MAG: hypothetical protein PHV23_02865 [Candidatus Gracilibacteria bacterium]|nr:hypothetical protein [Candidatus Gracilibacteria bacterium]
MFKKILVTFIFSLFLFSCGSTDIQVTENSLIDVDNTNFAFKVPSNWEIIKDKENILPKAKSGNIELAATSTNLVSGFANNLLILSDDLNKLTTSKDYSILNNIGAETDYLDYKKIGVNNITFADKEEGLVYEFEARYNLDTPKLRFLQTAHICNKTKGYFITIALPSSMTDTSKYQELLATFACK